MQDVTIYQFDKVVANIIANRYLGFNDVELPIGGDSNNQALHISITCMDTLLSRVLVDTYSSHNIIPNNTLNQILVEREETGASALTIRAFNGSKRQVISEINLTIRVGPHLFTIMFQVMDINPAYRCLLCRPWIYTAGAVTSTLHHKLKFMVEDKLVIISGEEGMLISEMLSFWYIETDEGKIEVPFHYLEFDNVITTMSNLDKVP